MDPVTSAVVSKAGKAVGGRIGARIADAKLRTAVIDACVTAAAETVQEALDDIDGRRIAADLIARLKLADSAEVAGRLLAGDWPNELGSRIADPLIRKWFMRFLRRCTDAAAAVLPATDRIQLAYVDDALARLGFGLGEAIAKAFEHATRPVLTLKESLWLATGVAPEDIEILQAYKRAIKLVGRDGDMARIADWLEDERRRVSVAVLVGSAGRGKTRLALESSISACRGGWHAGFLSTKFDPLWRWTQPTFVVVDYAASRADELKAFLTSVATDGELRGGVDASRPPLRLLLLEREHETGWRERAFGEGDSNAEAIKLLISGSIPVELPALAAAEDQLAVVNAVRHAKQAPPISAERWQEHVAALRASALARPDRDDWSGDPLFLMMATLAGTDAGTGFSAGLSRRDLARGQAARERTRIAGIAGQHGVSGEFLEHMAAFVTLCQWLPHDSLRLARTAKAEAEALLFVGDADPRRTAEALRQALRHRTRDVAGTNAGIEGIAPDIIGEAFILAAFDGLDDATIEGILLRAARIGDVRVAESLIHAAQDFSWSPEISADGIQVTGTRPLRWLTIIVEASDLARLMQIADTLPSDTLALAEVAASLHRSIGETLRALPAGEERDSLLGTSLNNLSIRLGNLGRREEALAACDEAVELRRLLAARRPDAFTPDLATSLNNISSHLSNLGQREEALAACDEAVGLYRLLAAQRSDVFTPRLATALNNLSAHLSNLGQREEALAACDEAIGVSRRLAASAPTPSCATSQCH